MSIKKLPVKGYTNIIKSRRIYIKGGAAIEHANFIYKTKDKFSYRIEYIKAEGMFFLGKAEDCFFD